MSAAPPAATTPSGGLPRPPFAARHPVRSLDDIRRIEAEQPLAEALATTSTYELFRQSAAAFGERTAIQFLHSVDPAVPTLRWSYGELLGHVHQLANLLHSLGVTPTDAVSILMPACPEYHQALWGSEAAAIVQPLNPLLVEDKLVALMKAARSRVLIAWAADAETDYWTRAMRLRERVPGLIAVLGVTPHDSPTPLATDAVSAVAGGASVGSASLGSASTGAAAGAAIIDFRQACAQQPDDRLISGRQIAPEDIAAYFHTGGTTGDPKLARHSHRAQVFTAWASVQMTGLGPTDSTINGYPLFHVAGVLPGALACFSAGVEVIIPTTTLLRNREVLRHYWQLVERFRATSLSAVPTVLSALADTPLDGADISTIRYCRTGAAPLSPELSARFERLFGLHVHEALGMTEMAGISTITPPGLVAPAGCVGLRLPHAELRVVALDANGQPGDQPLAAGQVGMVEFRSPNLFSGFVDPRDNAGVITDDGWLVTGDLGLIDEAGRLHLTGRAKDLIIRSGHNIDPKVIEDALDAHPAVQLVAAVGAPDAYAGEVPVAFVTLQTGQHVSEAELEAFVAGRVDEPPARPKRVHILERMPLTNVGKVFKPDLRRLAAIDVLTARLVQLWDEAGEAGKVGKVGKAGVAGGVAVPRVLDAGADGIVIELAAGTSAALATQCADEAARLGLKQVRTQQAT